MPVTAGPGQAPAGKGLRPSVSVVLQNGMTAAVTEQRTDGARGSLPLGQAVTIQRTLGVCGDLEPAVAAVRSTHTHASPVGRPADGGTTVPVVPHRSFCQ